MTKRPRDGEDGDADATMFSFGDTTILRSDVGLMRDSGWLNDRCIAFYFDYLTEVVFKGDSRFLFMCPSTTFLVRFYEDPEALGEVLEPLRVSEREYVFMPVNNNESFDDPGGSHWSLLVFEKTTSSFHSFDSMGGSNHRHALTVAKNMHPLLVPHPTATTTTTTTTTTATTPSSSSPPMALKFIRASSPQQANSYDCGVFVLNVAEHIASTVSSSSASPSTSPSSVSSSSSSSPSPSSASSPSPSSSPSPPSSSPLATVPTAVSQDSVTSKRNDIATLMATLTDQASAK